MVVETVSAAGGVEDEAQGVLDEGVAVGVVRTASAFAQGESNGIGAISPGVVLGRLGVEGQLGLVETCSLAIEVLSRAQTIDLSTADLNHHLAGGNGGGGVPFNGQVEVGSHGAGGGVQFHFQQLGRSVIGLGADVNEHAGEDGVRVDVVEGVGEGSDAHIVADQAAGIGFQGVLEHSAQSAAPANHAAIRRDLDQLIHGISHQGNADGAKVQLKRGRLVLSCHAQSQQSHYEDSDLHLLLLHHLSHTSMDAYSKPTSRTPPFRVSEFSQRLSVCSPDSN